MSNQSDQELDDIILAIVYKAGLIPRGKTVSADMFAEEKSRLHSHMQTAFDDVRQENSKIYEREIKQLRAFQEAVIRERELRIEPIYICAICSKNINLEVDG